MKDIVRSTMLMLCFLLAPSAAAAQAPSGGIGFGLSRGGPSIVPPLNLYAPFAFGSIRVEPSLGYTWTETEQQTVVENLSNPRRDIHMHRAVSTGLGVFLSMYELGGTYTYVGPRIKYIYSRQRTKLGTQPTRKVDLDGLQVAAVLGAEYLFGTAFSVGGEARLSYLGVRGPVDTPDPRTEMTLIHRSISTEAVVLFRWYFL